MAITQEEIQLIKATFKDNEPLMVAIRKLMYPVIDPNAPIGEQVDLWMNVDIDGMSAEQALINMKARNLFIGHVEGGLNKLKMLANMDEKTPEELKESAKKNSSK